MVVSAATRFASLPELICLLAEQIRSPGDLADLRLTSRAFASAVAPILFADICIGVQGTQALADFAECEHVRHVRRLRIENSYGDTNDCDAFNSIVQSALLPRVPRLESFTWHRILLAPETLQVLHGACPRLTALHIDFPEDDEAFKEDHAFSRLDGSAWEEHYPPLDLTVFSGLRELALLNIYDKLPWWRAHLVQVLRSNAASLRRLALSLSEDVLTHYEHINPSMYGDFFGKVCREYGQMEPPPPPMHLQSLSLGHGMYVFKRRALETLTDLRCLREVRVDNESFYEGYTEDDSVRYAHHDDDARFGGSNGLDLSAFGSAACPNLHRLSVVSFRADVHAMLAAADPVWARRVAVAAERMDAGFEIAGLLRSHPHLPGGYESRRHEPRHLRMLAVDLHRENVFLLDARGDRCRADPQLTAERVLADLVAGDGGALEGLAVHMMPHAGLYNSEFQHLDLLVRALRRLPGLAQLAIVGAKDYRALPHRALLATARRLAATVPALRYVEVCEFRWRVWRDGREGSGSSRGGDVRLEPLDRWEAEDVELFRLLVWRPTPTEKFEL